MILLLFARYVNTFGDKFTKNIIDSFMKSAHTSPYRRSPLEYFIIIWYDNLNNSYAEVSYVC